MTCLKEMVGKHMFLSMIMSMNSGLFLVVVLCVAVCCILGVVGVGYCVHHPTCPRPSSPFSDSSPSFHSAQLAFSSSPEVLTGDSQGKVQPGQARLGQKHEPVEQSLVIYLAGVQARQM